QAEARKRGWSVAGVQTCALPIRELPRQRQARWGERGAHPPRAAEGLGGQRAGGARESPPRARSDPEGLQRLAVRRQEGLFCRPRSEERRVGKEGGCGGAACRRTT